MNSQLLINDALSGGDMGSENSFSNGEFDSDDYTNRIVIYNFETKEWREGPRWAIFRTHLLNTQCMDKHFKVEWWESLS